MIPENEDPVENEEQDDSSEQNSDQNKESTAEDAANSDDPLDFGDAKMLQGDPVELLEAAEAKAAEHWERLVLMQADMENQRKRAQKDVANAKKFALEGIINELLPVRDSLEMGILAAQAEDAGVEQIMEGSELTLKMLTQAFEKHNISEVNPIDEKFDPEFHQAMSMQEVEGKEPNTVASVFQKGYTLNGRLLRPALVMVAK